jgi:deoxyribodipyrimidine photo-lyase
VSRTALMWFRRDLRLAGNPALHTAVDGADHARFAHVSPAGREAHAPGVAALARLDRSLGALATSLAARGASLQRLAGPAASGIPETAVRAGARFVACTRDWTPAGITEEREVAAALAEHGIELRVSESQLLAPPGTITTGAGEPFRVFTPYWRRWHSAIDLRVPQSLPVGLSGALRAGVSPSADPPAGGAGAGEAAALARLEEFVSDGLSAYPSAHDLPAVRGTSELSAALALGEVSPRQVARAAIDAVGESVAEPFLRQLAWREFAADQLHAHPSLPDEPLHAEFSAMPWRDDPTGLAAWTEGRTGWPIVDAGMRQLGQTGWMHNRVRMVAASALTKDLLVPWQTGAAAFEQLLADYDPALNAFNWQWVAGSGADAAPYFRIFNPELQGRRFDPDGAYVRRWVPELAALPARWIHRPAAAPADALHAAGVRLGVTYPRELIDHAEARVRALGALEVVRASRC